VFYQQQIQYSDVTVTTAILGSTGRSSRGIRNPDQSVVDTWEIHAGVYAVVLSNCSTISAQSWWKFSHFTSVLYAHCWAELWSKNGSRL